MKKITLNCVKNYHTKENMKNLIFVLVIICNLFHLHSKSVNKPNIIIMMADDMGYGDLACFGNKIIKTPNLDKLAKEGVKFTSCNSGHPSCSPSRAAMMTGRSPFRSGIYTFIDKKSCVHLRQEEETLGEIAQKAGYDTAFFGKWGLIGDMDDKSQTRPSEGGFDFWFATHNNATPSHSNPTNFYDNGKALGELKGYSSQLVVDNAIKWLNNRPIKSRPFLLVLWFHEPHLVLGQPESFRKKYSQYKGKKGDYYANVDHLDHQIGRFLSFLDDNKLKSNSWITFTSDNGPKKAEYGGSTGGFKGTKSSFYEGGTREPTIMYWNGLLEGGKTIETHINFFDFVPTFLDLLQVKKNKEIILDGTSLLPLFQGRKFERQSTPIWMGLKHTFIRQGDWKLIASFEDYKLGDSYQNYLKTRKLKSFQLFNIKEDPYEEKNVSKDYPELLQELKKLMNSKVLSVQNEMKLWYGRNVIPLMTVKRLMPEIKNKDWNEMSIEEQDHFGRNKTKK